MNWINKLFEGDFKSATLNAANQIFSTYEIAKVEAFNKTITEVFRRTIQIRYILHSENGSVKSTYYDYFDWGKITDYSNGCFATFFIIVCYIEIEDFRTFLETETDVVEVTGIVNDIVDIAKRDFKRIKRTSNEAGMYFAEFLRTINTFGREFSEWEKAISSSNQIKEKAELQQGQNNNSNEQLYNKIKRLYTGKENPDTNFLDTFINKVCIPYNIDYNLYERNFNNYSRNSEGKEASLNHLTPTLAKIHREHLEVRSFPECFYIAFPDVAYWSSYGQGQPLAANVIADQLSKGATYSDLTTAGYINPIYLKELVDMYIDKTGYKLECSIQSTSKTYSFGYKPYALPLCPLYQYQYELKEYLKKNVSTHTIISEEKNYLIFKTSYISREFLKSVTNKKAVEVRVIFNEKRVIYSHIFKNENVNDFVAEITESFDWRYMGEELGVDSGKVEKFVNVGLKAKMYHNSEVIQIIKEVEYECITL